MNKYKIKNFFYLLSLTIFSHSFLFNKDYFLRFLMNKRIIGIAKSIEKIRNTMPKCPNPESFDVLKKHSPLTTRQKIPPM